MKKANNNSVDIKEIYVTPEVEIIEFELKESIAVSGESFPGLACGEEIPTP